MLNELPLLSQLSDFHFLRPNAFWLLLPLGLFWLLKAKMQKVTNWNQIIPPHLAKVLLAQEQEKQNKTNFVIPCLWLVAVIAIAGPTWQKIEKPVFKVKRASVILMDMSMSMRSTDVKPDRLTKAKYKAIDLANAITDGEIALVVYAGDAFTISPLTQDSKNIVTLLPSLSPEIMPEPGSYPLRGLEQAASLLQQAGYPSGDIYWITDGIESEDMDELYQFAETTPYTVNTLAVGSKQGAPIKMVDGSLLKDHLGSIVLPKLNSSQLMPISTKSNGVFITATPTDLDIKTLIANQSRPIENQQQNDEENQTTGDDWQEFGPYLLLIILPFVLAAFRRGYVLPVFLCVMIMQPKPVLADEKQTDKTEEITPLSWLDTIFNTRDQIAEQAYHQQDYNKAQAHFDNTNWKGAAAYKAGNYEQALEQFSKDTSATGYYNQGNAYAHLGDYEKAIAAYDKTLALEPNHQPALTNKALLEAAQQQKQEQQQQENQQQQDNNQQQEQQKNDQNQDSQQQQDSNKNSEQDSQQESQNSQQQNNQDSADEPKPSESNSEAEQSQQQQNQQQSESESEQDKNKQQGESESEQGKKNKQQGFQPLTPEEVQEQENQQKLQQLLRKINDDPSVLIRNKMILESRKRQQQRRAPKGATKSW